MLPMRSSVIFISGIILSGCYNESQNFAPNFSTGIGGSLARFTIAKDHLYVVDNTSLNAFDILADGTLDTKHLVEIGVGIETIYPYNDALFIGANDAMYIYDIVDPLHPVLLSRYDHVMSCDPVVVRGDYAYVTLRMGACRIFGQEVLDVIDISNLRNPMLVTSEFLETPIGLGVTDDALFVCQGDNGLTVFDLVNPSNPVAVEQYRDIHGYDVIPLSNDHIIVTGDDGILQFSYSKDLGLSLLGEIPVSKNE